MSSSKATALVNLPTSISVGKFLTTTEMPTYVGVPAIRSQHQNADGYAYLPTDPSINYIFLEVGYRIYTTFIMLTLITVTFLIFYPI